MQHIQKHIITLLTLLLLLLLGSFSGEVWANSVSSDNSSDDVNNGKIVMNGNHAIFTFEASGTTISNAGWPTYTYELGNIDHGKTKECKFSWEVNEGSSIKVTKIEFGVRGYTSNALKTGEMKATFNGTTKSIGDIGVSYTYFSETNNNGFSNNIKLTLSNTCGGHGLFSKSYDNYNYYIGNISITYTITPDAPGVNPTTRTVNVTLPSNTSSPTTVNYSSCFSTSDHYGEFIKYAIASNPNSKGVLLNNGNFYATEAGTYTVYAYIESKKNCHEKSSNSSNLTITVNRLNPTMTYRDTTIDVSVNSTDDKTALNLDACRTSYTGNSSTFNYTKTSGDAAGVVSGNTFYATKIGDYTINATASETGQYSSVNSTFVVHVRKRANTLALVNDFFEEFVENDITNVITKNSNATLQTSSSDATIAFFNPTDKKIEIPNSEAKSFTSRDITISIWQAANEFYEASDTKKLTVRVKKYPTSFTGSAYNLMVDGTQTADYVYTNTSAAQPTANSADNFYYTIDNVSFTNSAKNNGANLVTFNPSNKQITACNAGTGKITFHQKETYKYIGATTSFNVAVYKYNSVFAGAVDLATTVEASVTSAYTLTYSKPNNSYAGTAPTYSAPSLGAGSGDFYYTLGHRLTTDNLVGCPEEYKSVAITYNAGTKTATGRNKGVDTIHLYQKETYKVNSANTSFKVTVDKLATSFTGSAYNLMVDGTQTADYVYTNTSAAQPTANSADNFYYTIDNVSFTNSAKNNGANLVTFNPSNKQITACNAGTGKITFHQKETYKYIGATTSFNVAVHKYNSVFAGVKDSSILVDVNATLSYTLTYTKPNNAYVGNNHAAGTPTLGESTNLFFYTIANFVTTNVTTGSADPTKVIAYNAESKVVTGKNQGVGTVALVQPETYKYAAATDTFRVIVSKHTNAFTCSWGDWTKEMNIGSSTPVTFATSNTGYANYPIQITQTYGEDVATLTNNNATDKTITTKSKNGYATWYLYQAPTYKYNSAEADVMVTVGVPAPPTCYVFEDYSEHTFSTNINDLAGHYDDPIEINGPADKIWFSAKKQFLGVENFVVEYSVDNCANWRTVVDNPDLDTWGNYKNYGPYSFQGLQSNERVTHIRFGAKVGATLSKWYKDIKVSRKAYLHTQDASGNNISTLQMPKNTMGSTVQAKFYIDYSTCAGTINIESNNPKFVLKKTSFAADGDNYGSAKEAVAIEYHSDEVSKDTAIISVYTNYQRCVLRVTGESGKKVQTLTWNDGFDTDPITVPISLVVNESNQAVTASSGNLVTYSTDDESIIEIINDGHGFRVIGVGSTTLTASEGGDDEWLPVSEERAIVTTDKTIQEISWLQTFPRHMEIGNEIDLTAKVYLRNISTGIKTFSQERTDLIVYSCDNGNGVITLDGKTITVIGYGSTTIQANVVGSDDYEAAVPVTMIINVREPSTGCETPLVFYQSEADTLYKFDVDFQHLSTPRLTSTPIILDLENGKPNKLSFQHSGEEYVAPVIGTHHYSGTILVEQRVNHSWSEVAGSRVQPIKNEWRTLENLQLNENADAIRFVRLEGGTGSHFYKDIRISKVQYMRTSETSIHYSDVTIGETRKEKITIEYSDLKSDLQITKGNPSDTWLVVPGGDEIAIECGEHGQLEVPIEFTPKAVGEWSNTLTITDTLSGKYVTITLTATMTKGTQTINWYPQTSIYTKSVVALNATATSGLPVSYALTNDGNGVAEMVAGQIVMHKQGSFTITASQSGDANYAPAEDVVVTFTASVTPTTIQTSPTADAIITGTPVGDIVLNGGVAVNTVNGQEVNGTFSITEDDLNTIGNNRIIDIHFTPDDENMYSGCDGTMLLTVSLKPLTVVVAPSASSITDEQKLSASVLSGGRVEDHNGNTVNGVWSWLYPESTYESGTYHDVEVVFTPYSTPSLYEYTTTTTTIVITPSSYRYEGEGLWSDAENWNRGIPGVDDEVFINGNVTISEAVEVKGITINEGSNVTLTVEGQLTVGDGDSKVLDGYGDLVVENGGKVILNDGELKVKDLIIEARLGDLEHSASSAEIDGEALLNVNGDVYFKLSFDPSGSISFGWYDFVVPFEVDVVGGIFLPSDTHTPLKNKVDYAIMEFSEEKYAAQQKFWLWNNTTLQPGKLYSITLDETKPYRNTFLFKRKGNATIGAPTSYRPSCTNEAKNTNKGWNGMGNGTLKHRQLSLPKGANPRIQVYDHANDCYVTCDAKDFQYAIGTAFFVQVSSSETINLMEVNSNRNFRAPVHETETTDEFIVTLKEENAEIVSDRLWFSASEEATGEYIIGRDLVKMGEPKDAKVARMWAVRDDLRLCDAEMPLIYSEADCAIDLFAPKQATYILEVEQAPEDAELYLTYNGKVIWDLTASPSSIVLTQGTKEGYGLRIKSNKASTPQGIEDTNVENNTMRKVLIDNTMYVITPQGAMYNVTGKFVR